MISSSSSSSCLESIVKASHLPHWNSHILYGLAFSSLLVRIYDSPVPIICCCCRRRRHQQPLSLPKKNFPKRHYLRKKSWWLWAFSSLRMLLKPCFSNRTWLRLVREVIEEARPLRCHVLLWRRECWWLSSCLFLCWGKKEGQGKLLNEYPRCTFNFLHLLGKENGRSKVEDSPHQWGCRRLEDSTSMLGFSSSFLP